MKITIRQANLEDSAELALLADQLGYPCSELVVQKNLKTMIPDPEYEVFVAVQNRGQVIGFVHVYLTRRLFLEPLAELGGMVVDERFRSQGAGEALLERCELWAREQGCKSLRVRSNIIRERAHGFYLKHGYSEHKVQRMFWKDIST